MSTDRPLIRLADSSRIVRVALDRSDDDLTITLTLLPQGATGTIEVRCQGASDVRFHGERTELKELVLLVAEDISSDGWEGVRYRVKDYEEEFMSFVCSDIDALR